MSISSDYGFGGCSACSSSCRLFPRVPLFSLLVLLQFSFYNSVSHLQSIHNYFDFRKQFLKFSFAWVQILCRFSSQQLCLINDSSTNVLKHFLHILNSFRCTYVDYIVFGSIADNILAGSRIVKFSCKCFSAFLFNISLDSLTFFQENIRNYCIKSPSQNQKKKKSNLDVE